jgi:DtxR family manganese transport transcriptional regulator
MPRPRGNPAAPAKPARRPRDQAADHRRTRAAHAQETAEDYAETIADLIDSGGEARVVDIARRLGVTHVTVVRTVARLQRDGWVTAKPYRAIFLTDAGRDLAQHARRRHRVVLDFLTSLGISEPAARTDAEGIEHHVSDETLAAFERFVKKSSRP